MKRVEPSRRCAEYAPCPNTDPWDLSLSAPIEMPTGTLRTLKDAGGWILGTIPAGDQKRREWQYTMGLLLKAADECTDQAIAAATERLRLMMIVERQWGRLRG